MTPLRAVGDTLRGRRAALRVLVAAWAAIFLAPILTASIALALIDGLCLYARLGLVAAGLATSGVTGWLGATRLLSTLGTVSDLLEALREGDYGIRGRVRRGRDPLQGLIADINLLSNDLRAGRSKRTESSRLLAKTLAGLQSPVFVFDQAGCVRLINPAARRLLGVERGGVIGVDAATLGLNETLEAADDAVLTHHFPTASGRWVVRRAAWYSEGREQTLVMLHDVSVTLGDEERRAWQRLIRVLSHELNNSLTPIGSLAGSLKLLMAQEASAGEFDDELRQGLDAIGRRASSLGRFLAGYGRLARLPPLHRRAFSLDAALARWVCLDTRLGIVLEKGASISVDGDEDQLGQAVINLLRNAVDASTLTGGSVRVAWRREHAFVIVSIEDEGPGLPTSDCLFVPFFTTKPGGSGIGLSLTRLIVEAHGGTVELLPRPGAGGAQALLRLPVMG